MADSALTLNGYMNMVRNAQACPRPHDPKFVRGPLATVQCDRCKGNSVTGSGKVGKPDVPEIVMEVEFLGTDVSEAIAYILDTGAGGFFCANCGPQPTVFHVTSLPLNRQVLPVYGPMRWAFETNAQGECIDVCWVPMEPKDYVWKIPDGSDLINGPLVKVARMSDPDDQNRSKVLSIFEEILILNRCGYTHYEISPTHPHPFGRGGNKRILAICNCGASNFWKGTIIGESAEAAENNVSVEVTEFARPSRNVKDSVTRYVVCDAQPCSRCMSSDGEFRCGAWSLSRMYEGDEIAQLGYDPQESESVFVKMKAPVFAVVHVSGGKVTEFQQFSVDQQDRDSFFSTSRNQIRKILDLPEAEPVPISQEVQGTANVINVMKAFQNGTVPPGTFISFEDMASGRSNDILDGTVPAETLEIAQSSESEDSASASSSVVSEKSESEALRRCECCKTTTGEIVEILGDGKKQYHCTKCLRGETGPVDSVSESVQSLLDAEDAMLQMALARSLEESTTMRCDSCGEECTLCENIDSDGTTSLLCASCHAKYHASAKTVPSND